MFNYIKVGSKCRALFVKLQLAKGARTLENRTRKVL